MTDPIEKAREELRKLQTSPQSYTLEGVLFAGFETLDTQHTAALAVVAEARHYPYIDWSALNTAFKAYDALKAKESGDG